MLSPAGDVAVQQRDLVVISTVLMLLIVVPVMVLTVLFAWRYRQSNSTARYEPEWDHSTQLELVIWSAMFVYPATKRSGRPSPLTSATAAPVYQP